MNQWTPGRYTHKGNRPEGDAPSSRVVSKRGTDDEPPDAEERVRHETLARKRFAEAYAAHGKRITSAIRSNGGDPDAAFWQEEPAKLQQAVLPFYDETTALAARNGLTQLPIGVDWEQVNEAVLRLAQKEAARFAEQATSTSRTQTSQVIADWIKAGGTMPELIDRVALVWEGPRPDVAAVSETTRIFAQGNAAAWQASSVVEGATIKTANDDRVCPICGPLADTDVPLDGELPPFHGGCRCWIVPRVKKPDAL